MTEADYIATTNLARIRAATQILADVLPNPVTDGDLGEVVKLLHKLAAGSTVKISHSEPGK